MVFLLFDEITDSSSWVHNGSGRDARRLGFFVFYFSGRFNFSRPDRMGFMVMHGNGAEFARLMSNARVLDFAEYSFVRVDVVSRMAASLVLEI